MSRRVEIEAPAKVNLHLRVLGRRDDGFHDIQTLFQAVGLHDRLLLEATAVVGVDLRVRGADLGAPEENLVTRAARSFLERTGVSGGLRVVLEKAIPAGAGLGGGSSDAAATFRALEQLFEVELDADVRRTLAAELGSDVPFFLGPSGLALGEGRGERLTALPPLPPAALVLGLPPVHVATGPAYAALARQRASADPPVASAGHDVAPPRTWEDAARHAVNDFQDVVAGAHPPVARALSALSAGEPWLSLLSGSGGAVFAVHPSLERARAAAREAARRAPETRFIAVPTLATLPAPSVRGP